MPTNEKDDLFRQDLFNIDYDQDMVDFGNKVRTERQKQGMTLERLANLINCDKASLSRFEKGERFIKYDNVLRIADALKISPWELFPDRFKENAFLTTAESRIHSGLLKFPESKRIEVMKYIIALLDGLLLHAKSHDLDI